MELDEMKLAWQSLDRRMARREALDLENYKERKIATARSRLRPLVVGQVMQLLLGIAMVMLSASFWVAHRHTPHLLVSGLLVQAWGLMHLVCAARELHQIISIDYAEPVLAIQRKLAQLRAWRIRSGRLFGAVGCVLWLPLLLVVFKAGLGLDLYARAPRIYAIVMVGTAIGSLVALLAFRRWMRHPRGAKIAKAEEDQLAGPSVNRAQSVLDEIARFERDL